MNRTEAAQRAISFAGPIALAAGTASLTAALVSAATHVRYPAQAGQPHPAPTVTVTATSSAAPAPVVGRTPGRASPSSSPSSVAAIQTQVLPAGQLAPSARAPRRRPRPAAPSGPGPSGPSPSPTAAADCRGALADAQALHAVCVTVGGSR